MVIQQNTLSAPLTSPSTSLPPPANQNQSVEQQALQGNHQQVSNFMNALNRTGAGMNNGFMNGPAPQQQAQPGFAPVPAQHLNNGTSTPNQMVAQNVLTPGTLSQAPQSMAGTNTPNYYSNSAGTGLQSTPIGQVQTADGGMTQGGPGNGTVTTSDGSGGSIQNGGLGSAAGYGNATLPYINQGGLGSGSGYQQATTPPIGNNNPVTPTNPPSPIPQPSPTIPATNPPSPIPTPAPTIPATNPPSPVVPSVPTVPQTNPTSPVVPVVPTIPAVNPPSPIVSPPQVISVAPNPILSGIFSDERLKTNISKGDNKIDQFLNTIKAHNYEYKHKQDGVGQFTSPMAQELEATELGKQAVIETPRGKMVDYARLGGVNLAAVSVVHRETQKLQKQIEELRRQVNKRNK